MKVYGAIPSGSEWTVGKASEEYMDFVNVGDVRKFSTFEEADRVARDIAAGKYPDCAPAGLYINMR